MRHFIVCLLFSLLLFPLLCFGAGAETWQEEVEDFAETESITQDLTEEEREELTLLLESRSPGALFSFLLDALLPTLRDTLPFFFRMLALTLAAALFRAAKNAFGKGVCEGVFDLVLTLVFVLSTYPSLEGAITLCGRTLSSLSSFMLAGLPAMTILHAMAGQSGSASLQATFLSFFVSGSASVYSSLFFPAVKSLFALLTAGALGEGGPLPLFRLGKKLVKTATVLVFTVLSAQLGLQNALALAGDTLAMRSVRFAAGNFIPVVGSLVGENARAIAATIGAVKTNCGATVVVLILVLTLPCILALWCKKIFLSLSSAVAGMLGEEKLSKLLQSVGELFDLLLALTVAQSVFFIFYIALFLKGGAV